MNPAIAFLLFMVGVFGTVGGVMATVLNFDRIVVFLLRSVSAPVYKEARRLAALIYQHPEQWKASSYSMEHPKIGRISGISYVRGVEVDGPFGQWEPNYIERRIIYDAVKWYRSYYMKYLLVKTLDTPH